MRLQSIVVAWLVAVAVAAGSADAQPGCVIDNRALITAERGIIFQEADVAPGQWYWKLVRVEWCDYDHSGLKVNIFYKAENASGGHIDGQTCYAGWHSDSYPALPPNRVPIMTKVYPEWGDYPMAGGSWCPSWPDGGNGPYVAWVGSGCPADGSYCPSQSSYPSDVVWGMGLPCNHHECYYFTWRFTQAEETEPELARAPSSFSHTIELGDSLAPDTFQVWNAGGETLTYYITDNITDPGWLSQAPTSGTATDETDDITVSYNTAGLALGTHYATIWVVNQDIPTEQLAIQVDVTVEVPQVPGDFDSDGDVDQADFGFIQSCFRTYTDPVAPAACDEADLNQDNVLSHSDVDVLLGCMSGEGVQGDTSCDE